MSPVTRTGRPTRRAGTRRRNPVPVRAAPPVASRRMTEQTTGRPPEGGGRPQHARGPQEERREADLRRAEIRRLGAKYAECHAELLRRLGE
ncbi:hypothetical protein GCM10009663_23000 [Kitasatospora arboriphila]|uniref:Uncharacterized protein n=2 Tax=Streptomycetaceae TaxID=2062 RepID=A0ABP4DYI5_9ACTN